MASGRFFYGIADELISSQSYDWITKKVYIAVDRVGTKKSGRIEACPIDSNDGCTILLTNDFGMHSLVVDPTEGYMYWLNKVEKRIESAWMDGQFLNKNPFIDTFLNDPKVKVAALTLDPMEKQLYYLRVWQEKYEIVSCKIHHRSSCKVVATPDEEASHLSIYKDKLFWSNFHGKIYFCQKTTKVVSNLSGFERFMFLDSEVQPQRVDYNECKIGKDQNLCAFNNGGCSHFCILHPGQPFRNCVCPIGVRLLSNNATCDPLGVRRALFIAAKTTLFYISLDTREFAPKRIAFEDENPSEPISIIDVDYDPLRENLYWLDSAKGEVRRSFLNGTNFEIVASKLSPFVKHIAFDWLGRNLYLLNSETGRLEIQKVEGGFYRKILFPGFIYFGNNFYGEHARIERAWMDGTHRQVLISLPKVTSIIDLVVDSEGDRIYWIEGESSKIGSAKLSNGGDIKVISNYFQHFQAIAKLGDVLYSSSSFARSITAISLGKNDFPLQKDFFDGETSDGSKYEQFDSVIFHQTALKAAILRPKYQDVFSRHNSAVTAEDSIISKSKHSKLNINGCFPGNGGCSEICVNLPALQYQCLCSTGSELQQDLSTCISPDAFFVLTQSNVTNDLMRLSLIPETPNYETLAVSNISSIPQSISLDSTRKFIYFSSENFQFGLIQKTPFIGGSVDTVIQSSTLRSIRGTAIDSISDTLFISNGFLKRIEAISLDGRKRRTLIWDKIDPKFLVLHPQLRKLFFVNSFGERSDIVWISTALNEKINVMAENVGNVTALEIDVKSNKIFWSTITDSQGVILSTRIDTGYTEQLIGTSTILPRALTFYNENLYVANGFSGTIDILLKYGTSKQFQTAELF
uniref:EGF-like domain-containing protein n=1 Tax=Panagrolaimus davidi TaxID=227884 RepID=A0A914Q1M4_9BILA